jgi:hypothetical protein
MSKYDSSEGMTTRVFGPLIWCSLHIISFNYPVNPTLEDKRGYKQYLLSLRKVLPCKYCRENFITNLKAAGFSNDVFKNRDSFSRFIYKFHNTVNKMLGKPNYETYEFVRERYETFRASCGPAGEMAKEKGCLVPFNGIKSKATICIVPLTSKKDGFNIDKRCKK